MESFDTAPVIRFYGSDVVEAGDEPARPDDVPPPSLDRPELRLVPPRKARAPGRIVMLATVAGLAAVGLATWAFVSVVRTVHDESPRLRVAQVEKPKSKPKPTRDRAVALLASPSTERYRIAGALGRITLAVTPGDRGFLVVNGLGAAPSGRVYEAWVIPPAGRSIRSAARFRGKAAVVPLRVRVPEGAAVAITLEHAGGAAGPTKTPRLVAIRRP